MTVIISFIENNDQNHILFDSHCSQIAVMRKLVVLNSTFLGAFLFYDPCVQNVRDITIIVQNGFQIPSRLHSI